MRAWVLGMRRAHLARVVDRRPGAQVASAGECSPSAVVRALVPRQRGTMTAPARIRWRRRWTVGACRSHHPRSPTLAMQPQQAHRTSASGSVLGSPRMSPLRCTVAVLALFSGCVPEPASAVEIRTAVDELVDQTRAMAIEHAIVDLTTNVDPAPSPREDGQAAVRASARRPPRWPAPRSAQSATRHGTHRPRRHRAAASPVDRVFTGVVERDLRRADPRRAHGDDQPSSTSTSEGSALAGTMEVTWGADETRRVVSEVRLDHAGHAPDRDPVRSDPADPPRRAAGRRLAPLADAVGPLEDGASRVGSSDPGRRCPTAGSPTSPSPYEHDIVLRLHRTARRRARSLRANGGRRDHVFAVAADGEILDLGDD
jgi:hypothetical protein